MKNLINHLKEEWYKYVLEIIVITFGIIGAFTLNNWNEKRKNTIEEQIILYNLKEEIRTNQLQLEKGIHRMEKAANSSAVLMNLAGPNPPILQIDSIEELVRHSSLNSTFRPGQGVSLDIINSGKLVLIRNDSLRQLLSNLPSLVLDSQDDEEAIYEARERFLIPYLEDKLNFHGTVNIDTTRFTITNLDFLSDLRFQNRISRLHFQLRYIRNEYLNISKVHQQMLEIIEVQLATL